MFCRNCGNKIQDGEDFCGNCGNKVPQGTNIPAKSTEQTAVNCQTIQQPLQSVPVKNDNNFIFNILSIVFITAGIGITIYGFNLYNISYDFENYGSSFFFLFSISISLVIAGFIFSFISIYKNKNNNYFIFCLILYFFVIIFVIFLGLLIAGAF